MKVLIYDCETSGLPLFNEPSEDPRQPHLVQLAAVLFDLSTRKTIASMDVIVRPSGWQIPAEVAAIHGITTGFAQDVGISELLAVEMLLDLWNQRTRVAHNESFDARLVRIAMMRLSPRLGVSADQWKAGAAECTQKLATPILQLPPTAKMRAVGRNHFKSANLAEAYKHFTGKDLINAHSAMADVQACLEVYLAIKAIEPKEAA